MDEKTLVTSKRGNIAKIVAIVIIVIGIIAFAIIWSNETSHGFYQECIEEGDWDYVFGSMVPYFGSMTLLPAIIISAILYLGTARCSMTITDKRVYGKASFGKRVDLPLDSISAIGTSALKGLAIATSSGKIKFYDIANQEEMHSIMSGLLVDRQGKEKNVTTTIKQEIPQSNADELKKYKELFDSGVISQEEFDAKKKQLLGL